ncbi:MAG: hypothetical protein U1C33_04000, partial [Candidatus Cloacimonadaceae bacterium]|nr:hypothetical protein [Candidatus Cloacimonadaceae bacterium]
PFWKADASLAEGSGNTARCQLAYHDYRQIPLDCTVQISSLNSKGIAQSSTATKDKEQHHISFDFEADGQAPIDLISAIASYPAKEFCLNRVLFRKQASEPLESITKAGDNTIYSIDNGIIQIQVSPEFAPAVFSLRYQNNEWFDSSFPDRCAKSWWNPWCGGAEVIPNNMLRSAWLAEKHQVSFVQKQDNFAQVWKGIEIKTRIANNDSLKGICVCQYFMVLPGLPVIAMYATYQQDQGFYRHLEAISRIFVKADEDIKNSSYEISKDDQLLSTNCGVEDIEFNFEGKLMACRGKHRQEKLYFYCTKAPSRAFAGSDIFAVSLLFYDYIRMYNRESKASQLKFIILSELSLPEKALIDLDNIRIS